MEELDADEGASWNFWLTPICCGNSGHMSQQLSLSIGLITPEDATVRIPSLFGMDIISTGSLQLSPHAVMLDIPVFRRH